jgi:long-chain acyl-CoA synthetase
MNRSTGAGTVTAMVLKAAARHTGTALRHPGEGGWTDVSYGEVGRIVREIAAGLLALGVGRGDRVALLAGTRAEWTLCDLGALCAGAVVVPVYHTNSPEETRYVLEHSVAKVLICENAEQLAKVRGVRDELPGLEHVIAMEDAGADELSLDDLRLRGAAGDLAAVDAVAAAMAPDDLATIVYTSGTTGPPKGCELTHGNFMFTVHAYDAALGLGEGEPPVIFLFLPLAHALARVTQLAGIDVGGSLAFWRGDMTKVMDDLAQTRPTHFPSVPRAFEKIHARAVGRAESKGGITREVFRRAVPTALRVRALRRRGERVPLALRARHAVHERLVFAKVRKVLGGNMRLALTGAAPIGTDVLEFFEASDLPVMEGYGMTESTAAATLNTPNALVLGSVGRALPGMEVAIAPDGEVLIRGPHVFRGYHRDEEATRAVLGGDGWLHSGDLGEMDDAGFLTITGRKKDLIITSSGKNIAPSVIETALREERLVSQAVVYGDRRSYLVALITLDADELPELAERLGVEPDAATMARDPAVREELQRRIDAINARFARIEQIKRFAILPRDLTQASGELTPTLKVKRAFVYERYAGEITALYGESPQGAVR